jgi:hypothetical protein
MSGGVCHAEWIILPNSWYGSTLAKSLVVVCVLLESDTIHVGGLGGPGHPHVGATDGLAFSPFQLILVGSCDDKGSRKLCY